MILKKRFTRVYFKTVSTVSRTYLSATCPAMAENKKNGAVKIQPAIGTSSSGSKPFMLSSCHVTKVISASFKNWSLNAPKIWAKNNGAKRRENNSGRVFFTSGFDVGDVMAASRFYVMLAKAVMIEACVVKLMALVH